MMPDQIGPYRVLGRLGDGGSATVYRVADNLGRQIAIKQLHPVLSRDTAWRQRFKDDATLMATLKHTNIVEVLTFHDEDVPYFTMELVPGETLKQLLDRRHALPPAEAVGLAVQACSAFTAVHAAGITHRDIKPDNLMVSQGGVVKVLDFSIARNNGARRQTSAGRAIGTVGYMSPEQLRGQTGDPRSDIYALGATLYEVLAGVPVFDFEAEYDVADAHVKLAAPALTGRVAKLPAHVNTAVLKALEKRPDDRFQTMAAFAEALTTGRIRTDTSRTTLLETRPNPMPDEVAPARTTSGAAKYVLAGAALLAAAVISFIVINTFGRSPEPPIATLPAATLVAPQPAGPPPQVDRDLASVRPQTSVPTPPAPLAPRLSPADADVAPAEPPHVTSAPAIGTPAPDAAPASTPPAPITPPDAVPPQAPASGLASITPQVTAPSPVQPAPLVPDLAHEPIQPELRQQEPVQARPLAPEPPPSVEPPPVAVTPTPPAAPAPILPAPPVAALPSLPPAPSGPAAPPPAAATPAIPATPPTSAPVATVPAPPAEPSPVSQPPAPPVASTPAPAPVVPSAPPETPPIAPPAPRGVVVQPPPSGPGLMPDLPTFRVPPKPQPPMLEPRPTPPPAPRPPSAVAQTQRPPAPQRPGRTNDPAQKDFMKSFGL